MDLTGRPLAVEDFLQYYFPGKSGPGWLATGGMRRKEGQGRREKEGEGEGEEDWLT